MTCQAPTDFLSQLRPASFGGVRFHVDSTSEDYGRRVVVHEFPLGDTPFNEDLGRKARKVNIEGYLVGDSWLSARDRLIAACESDRSRSLQHPFYPGLIQARCETLNVQHAREELGMVKFSMSLVEEFRVTGSVIAGFTMSLIEEAVSDLVSAAGLSFRETFQAAGLDDFVRSDAVANLQGWAGILDDAASVTVFGEGVTGLTRGIDAIFSAAETLSVDAITGGVLDLFTIWRDAPLTAVSGALGLSSVLTVGVDTRPALSDSASIVSAARNDVAINALFRRTYGALWAEFTAGMEYSSRDDAGEARAKLARFFDSELQLVSPTDEPGVYEALDRLRARVMKDINQKYVDARPVMKLTLPRQTSALALATRLYGDPSRAEEVWKRSGSAHPSFIGREIEVLAR